MPEKLVELVELLTAYSAMGARAPVCVRPDMLNMLHMLNATPKTLVLTATWKREA